MAYSINKTDGSLLVTLVDSAVDRGATDLVLIGKNVTGYGEYINENFVKLLENFASTSEPNNPITGQLWFDVAENRLKVYDGVTFRIGAGPIVQGTPPLDPQQGDFWIDNFEGRLYFYDGINRYPASKAYNNTQGESGFFVESIQDSNGNTKTITKLYSGSKLLGVFSNHPEFVPAQSLGSDFTGSIKPGFTPSTLDGFKFHARAASADSIVRTVGSSEELLTTDDLMLADYPNTITETLTIQNEEPLILGLNGDNIIQSTDTEFNISTTRTSQDFKLYTRPIGVGTPAIFVKASTNSIGIFNNNPSYSLDVTGNVRITGDLLVDGGTTTISTTNLEVEDKLIDLSKVTSPSDTIANGGGIRLLGTTNHTLTWSNANDSWDSSEHFNLLSGKQYRINNVKIIDQTSLGTSVVSSSLTSVGTLTSLNVSTGSLITNITDNIISSQTSGASPANLDLILNPKGLGTVNVNNSNISNMLDPRPGPGYTQDAATRGYVDQSLGSAWFEVSNYYEMSIQDRVLANTSAGTFRLVLPTTSGLSAGQFVRVIDLKGTFDSSPLQISRYREIDTTTFSGNSAADGVYANTEISASATVGVATSSLVSPTIIAYEVPLTNLDTTDGLAEGTDISANPDVGSLYGGTALSCKVLTVDSPTSITYRVVGVVGTLTAPVAGNVDNLTIQGLPTTTSGAGYGLELEVIVNDAPDLYTSANTTINIINHGYGYRTGDTVTVAGNFLGGSSPAHDLTFTVNHTNIFGVDDDVTVNDPNAAFGLFYAGYANGWKYSELQVLPSNIIGDLTGNVISQNTSLTVLDTTGATATFNGDVSGDLTGNVNGNVSGNVTSLGDNSFATVTINGGSGSDSSLSLAGYNQRGGVGYHGFMEATNTYSSATNPNKYFRLNSVGTLEIINSAYSSTLLSLTDAGVLSTIGGFQGNVTNGSLTVTGTNTLTLASNSSSITMRSGNGGVLISGYDDTATQDQYAIQVDPGSASGNRSTTYLYGDVVVQNIATSNVNGSSFKLPNYTAAQLAARTLTFLNYGELIYNSDAKKIQAYVEDDGSGFPGWVDLH